MQCQAIGNMPHTLYTQVTHVVHMWYDLGDERCVLHVLFTAQW